MTEPVAFTEDLHGEALRDELAETLQECDAGLVIALKETGDGLDWAGTAMFIREEFADTNEETVKSMVHTLADQTYEAAAHFIENGVGCIHKVAIPVLAGKGLTNLLSDDHIIPVAMSLEEAGEAGLIDLLKEIDDEEDDEEGSYVGFH